MRRCFYIASLSWFLSLDFSLSIYPCLKVAMYVVGVCVSVTPIFLHVRPNDEISTQQILILRSYLGFCITDNLACALHRESITIFCLIEKTSLVGKHNHSWWVGRWKNLLFVGGKYPWWFVILFVLHFWLFLHYGDAIFLNIIFLTAWQLRSTSVSVIIMLYRWY